MVEVFHMPDDAGRFTMENPPLQRVLVDLQYPLSPRLVMPDGLAELQSALQSDFPTVRPLAAPGFTISFGSAPPMDPALSTRYQFSNPEGYEIQVGVMNTTLSIAGVAYQEGLQTAALLTRVATAIQIVGRINQCDRIGVRYINAAPATPSQWVKWFKSEFTGWTETGIVDERATRVAMLITQLAFPEGQSVTAATVRHGYLPNGLGQDLTTSAASREPSFLVDIDMAADSPMLFDPNVIQDSFRAILREVARYLRYTFTPEGEAHFGVHTIQEKRETE